jgi:dolichol kinase
VTGKSGEGHVVLIMIAADAMAAIIGKNLGKIKISKTKTL